MHTSHCLKIAHRMHLLLRREIGRGLDLQRMLRDALYARDVLLVCDAMPRTELPELAQFYRRAATGPGEAEIAAARRARYTLLGATRFLLDAFGAGLLLRSTPMLPRPTARPSSAH